MPCVVSPGGTCSTPASRTNAESVLRRLAPDERRGLDRRRRRTRRLGEPEGRWSTALFDSHVSSSIEIVRHHDERAREPHARRNSVGDGADPARGAALVVRHERPVHAQLRLAVHERRVVRERAAIPVQRRVHVRARAEVVEPARAAVREQQVQPIGMSVPAARLSLVERDVYAARRRAGTRRSPGPRAARTGDDAARAAAATARAQSSERQPRSARVSADGGALRSTSADEVRRPVSRRGNVVVVQPRQRAADDAIAVAREAQLALLGEARLAKRDRVLRILARRQREVRQRGAKRRGEPALEASDERRGISMPADLGERARRTTVRDARRDDSSRPRTRCRRRAARCRGGPRVRRGRARSRSTVLDRRAAAAAISAALFHTWRFDMPSSYCAMSAALGSTMRSRTRSASARDRRASSRSAATQICSSQIDSR